MANPCPAVGLGLGFVAMVGIIYTLASKEWKVNSQVSSSNVDMGIHSYEGLWVRCTSPQSGQLMCDNYDESMLALPADLQGQRALMCLALISAILGVIAGAVGLECIAIMSASKMKVWTGRSGGIGMLFAAIMTITAVSWYAAGVVDDFQTSQVTGAQFAYEFGSALYVGWVSGGIALISGFLMLICNRFEEDKYDPRPYTYKSPQGGSTEYI